MLSIQTNRQLPKRSSFVVIRLNVLASCPLVCMYDFGMRYVIELTESTEQADGA